MGTVLTPKADELVADPFRHEDAEHSSRMVSAKSSSGFGRALRPSYPITVFYAFKQAEADDHGQSSTGWETLLDGMIQSGWQVTGTWPMRTEREPDSRHIESNALASSIVLACRPRDAERKTTDRRGVPGAAPGGAAGSRCGNCSRGTSRRWTWRRRRSGLGWRCFPGTGKSPSRTGRRCGSVRRCS